VFFKKKGKTLNKKMTSMNPSIHAMHRSVHAIEVNDTIIDDIEVNDVFGCKGHAATDSGLVQ
jgi:hypothetical protein